MKYFLFICAFLGVIGIATLQDSVATQRAADTVVAQQRAEEVLVVEEAPAPRLLQLGDAIMLSTDIELTEEYKQSINTMNSNLGITESDLDGLVMSPPAGTQVDVGRGVTLNSNAASAYKRMEAAAKAQGLRILPISGYRSPQHQHDIIRNKLNAGQDISYILTVNRPPGYSQHNSGLAIDVGEEGEPTYLTQDFENTATYKWLERNAASYGFVFPYPENNDTGIIYEPWHMFYVGVDAF